MEKQKPWQLYLIIAVIALTLYNVFPTIFFYTKPLQAPINVERSHAVAEGIVERVNSLEEQAVAWLGSFANMLHLNPAKITLRKDDPRFIDVVFAGKREAELFKELLPRAGNLISFVPAQLGLGPQYTTEGEYRVVVERRIGVHFDQNELNQLFKFSWLLDEQGQPTPLYRQLVADRAADLAIALGGSSPQAKEISLLESDRLSAPVRNKKILDIAQDIVDAKTASAALSSEFLERYYASYSQTLDSQNAVEKLSARMKELKSQIQAQILAPSTDGDPEHRKYTRSLERQVQLLDQATALIERHKAAFNASSAPLLIGEAQKVIETAPLDSSKVQTYDLANHNPFVKALVIDWAGQTIRLQLYKDIEQIRNSSTMSEEQSMAKEKLNQLIVNEIARVSQTTHETLSPVADGFAISVTSLTNTRSILAMDLGVIAAKEVDQILHRLKDQWAPSQVDLERSTYPVISWQEYKKLPAQQQKLGLVVYAPATEASKPQEGFEPNAIYVIARGLVTIAQKYNDAAKATGSEQFMADFEALKALMEQRGYLHAAAQQIGLPAEYAGDYVFLRPDYYDALIKSTRENLQVKGSQRLAVLDFTDVEQRIVTLNSIEDRIQEDLLKWRDDYETAQVSLDPTNRYLIPPPTANPLWANMKLSSRKYFRGDQNRVIKWGLDLSGGKTVRIGLRDQNGRPVTDDADLHQVVNELYTRINKMGVSERTIRIEGHNIILDFPGSQGISAEDLVKASSMTFHIVNEKFGDLNRDNWEDVNKFLQTVWDEAVVTNRRDSHSINEIAWKHLGGEEDLRSHVAQTLYDLGLRFAGPQGQPRGGAFDDTISMIATMRGNDFSQWQGHSHPLVIVFRNYALEGASLQNVRVGYDPREGNMLMFEVRSSYLSKERRSGNPQNDLYAWTSQFSKEKIQGTQKEQYSGGNGWRMAVILNDQIITSPNLQGALNDKGQITGRFSQREVNQLASDLKAGSLSFTPQILSEENVSPELGSEERTRGITASLVALAAVILAMCGYYRFAGLVACVAVFFNLLILWGVLQSLGAALTLPGIAGVVLTIGMAVDANVLVFERYREEFRLSGRVASAIQAGYRKAFSAIVDSNITTIIAALILVQFDSGPIKGFAVTLIIGIIASMFTALFMTRYFFAGWVANPKHKELKMMDWVGRTNFDFLAQTRKAFIGSVIVILVGFALLYSQRHTIFGMDFTGGYSLTVTVAEKPGVANYAALAKAALEADGADSGSVQVQQLSRSNQLRIRLGMGIEEVGKPFHELPDTVEALGASYEYQHNPRIQWVVDALRKGGVDIEPAQLASLNLNWTVMSGQFSQAMRDNAAYGLGLALLAILIYITLRFEFKFAIAAVIGLGQDVMATIGFIALFHMMGLPIDIDLQVIGAIMLIIGYALNDTIIVFDRLREDIRLLRKLSFADIINHALNVTLNRTLMTSGTTMLVLLVLVLLGGKTIFGFALVMLIGVGIGTLSSLFIAPPMLLYFHNREERKLRSELELKRV